MTRAQALRDVYGFEAPDAYRRLEESGWLAGSLETSINLLKLYWLGPQGIVESGEAEQEEGEADSSPSTAGFVPFARTVLDDDFGWYRPWATSEHGCSVVLGHVGEDEVTLVAPSFEGFLYRRLVEACGDVFLHEGSATQMRFADGKFDRFDEVLPHALAESLRATVRDLKDYLPPDWARVLEEITARPYRTEPRTAAPHGRDYEVGCFLDADEISSILKRDLGELPELTFGPDGPF